MGVVDYFRFYLFFVPNGIQIISRQQSFLNGEWAIIDFFVSYIHSLKKFSSVSRTCKPGITTYLVVLTLEMTASTVDYYKITLIWLMHIGL